jgi:hypothetical protein
MNGDREDVQRAISDPGAMTIHLGYTDTDIYGRGWDPIFGKGSLAITAKEAKLKLKAIRDAKSGVRIGDHIDYDLYGRGDPRIFGYGADIANRNEAAKALYKSQQYKIMQFRTTVFPSAAKALLRLSSIPKQADARDVSEVIGACQDESPDQHPYSEASTLLPSEIADLPQEGALNAEHDDEHLTEPNYLIKEQLFEVELAVLVPRKSQSSALDAKTPASERPLSAPDIGPKGLFLDANFSSENGNPESSQEYLPTKGQSIAARMRAFEQPAPSKSLSEQTQAAQKRDETRSEGIMARPRFFESQAQTQRLEKPHGVPQELELKRPIGLRSRSSTEDRDKLKLPPDTIVAGQDRSEAFALRILIDHDVPNKERHDVPSILSPPITENDVARHPVQLDSRDGSQASKKPAPAGITSKAEKTWEILSRMPDEANICTSNYDGTAEKSLPLNRGSKDTSNFMPSFPPDKAGDLESFGAESRGQTDNTSPLRAERREPPPGLKLPDEQNASNELDSKGHELPKGLFPDERGVGESSRPQDSSADEQLLLSEALKAPFSHNLSPSTQVEESHAGYSSTAGHPEIKSPQSLRREYSAYASGSREGNAHSQVQDDIPEIDSARLRETNVSKMVSPPPDREYFTAQTTETILNRGGLATGEKTRSSDSSELESTVLHCKSSDTINFDTNEIQVQESTDEATSSSSSSSIQSDSSAVVDIEGSASGRASSSSDFVEGSSETELSGQNGAVN